MDRSRLALTIVVLLLMASLFSSCRFGNNTEDPPAPPNPDKVTGGYKSEAVTLKYAVTLRSSGVQSINSVAPNQVPDEVGLVISNPVAVLVTDPVDQLDDLEWVQAQLFNPFYGGSSAPALPVFVNQDTLELSLSAQYNPVTFFTDSACVSQVTLNKSGQLYKENRGNIGGLPIVGRAQILVTVLEEIDGDCDADLQLAEDCYFDHQACGQGTESANQSAQTAVQNTFNPYIDAGSMVASDISDVAELLYQVAYE